MTSIMADQTTGRNALPLAFALAHTDLGEEMPASSWVKSSHSGSNPYGNCVELQVVRPAAAEACRFCGGDGTDGAGHVCGVCDGTGRR